MIHCKQSGRLVSAHKFEDAAYLAVGGKYAAWVLKSDPPFGNVHDDSINEPPSDIIYWRDMSRDGPRRPVKTVDAARLWTTCREAVSVFNLFVNEDGILLVSVKYGRRWVKRVRTVVYSIVDDTILWSEESKIVVPLMFVPLAIGACHVYAATWDGKRQRYTLTAEDYTAGQRSYSSDVLTSDWTWADRESSLDFGCDFASVVAVSDGKELLLQLRYVGNAGLREIEVIRGCDGTIVGRLPCTDTGLNSALSHLPTGHLAFTAEATSLSKDVVESIEVFGRYRIFITRRFSYSSETGMQLVYADVVLVLRDWAIRPNRCPWSPVAIDPFNKAAFISSTQKPEEKYSNSEWTVWSCPLVQTENTALHDAAVAAMRHAFPDAAYAKDSSVISRCYVLGDGVKVTLPINLAKGRMKREPLTLPSPMGYWITRVEGRRILFFLEDDCYALNFL
ncbi:hypothetical protein BJX64DRAFT_225425 [Aspergillus heterothallicus]